MGTTASTKPSHSPSNPAHPGPTKGQNTAANGTTAPSAAAKNNAKAIESQETDLKPDPSIAIKDDRKEYLKRKLRSKVRAIALFRKSVQASSVSEGNEEEDEDGSEEEMDASEEQGKEGAEGDKLRSLDILYHPSNNREELRKFLWQRRQETEDCWDNIQTEDREIEEKYSIYDKKGDDADDGAARRERYTSRKGGKVSDAQRLPPPMRPVDNDVTCDMCHQLAAFSVPCRICTRVYHRKCLHNSGRYRDTDRSYIDRATSKEGWTCYNCEDMCLLLSAPETAEMMDDFDTYDIDKDESISLVEFLKFKKRQYKQLDGREMPEEEEELVRAQFTRMDSDGSAEIDWWEFMKFEARRYLARKSGEDLVGMLTPKELLQAKNVFLAATAGQEPEYTYFQGVFLGTAVTTWDDFIHDQALYIIWSRPNREHVLVI